MPSMLTVSYLLMQYLVMQFRCVCHRSRMQGLLSQMASDAVVWQHPMKQVFVFWSFCFRFNASLPASQQLGVSPSRFCHVSLPPTCQSVWRFFFVWMTLYFRGLPGYPGIPATVLTSLSNGNVHAYFEYIRTYLYTVYIWGIFGLYFNSAVKSWG